MSPSGLTGKCLFFSFSGTRFVCSDSISSVAAPKRLVGFAIFLRAAHVGGGVGERNARFGHPDKFDRLLRRDRERQRFRISQADVFARENHDPARDETKVFAGMQHFRQPVDRAFFIGGAHAFDEGADRVVVRVALAIVNDRFLSGCFPPRREVKWITPLSFGGVVSTPISSAFRHLRASPSLSLAR